MSEAASFAFLAGGSIGFLIGIIVVASISADEDKKRVRKGSMTVQNTLYKLTEINP